MKKICVLLMCWLWTLTAIHAQQVIVVKKDDAQGLLKAVAQANERNAAQDAEWLYILIPNGFYDLGETVLTKITGHNIALIGESMKGTIIQNKPDIKNEGISKTAIFQNRGTGNYFQDLTLKNALDYYASGAAGRAVTLQDKGTQTICNRVCMLAYQDTYYTDNDQSQIYLQDSEIHGTVDFICGDGDVWFERCRIVTEKRSLDGKGRNVIAAPKSKTPWGYIFNNCTVENIVSNFELARGWNNTPHCIWLNTTLLTPEKLNATRFDYHGMRTVQNDFKEYGTKDAQGRDITPKSNVVTFELKTGEKNTVETILTAEEAKKYTLKNVFPNWQPSRVIKQIEKKVKKLKKKSF